MSTPTKTKQHYELCIRWIEQHSACVIVSANSTTEAEKKGEKI